jgi:hypothetical protein
MDMLRWTGRTFARLVGVIVMILSGWGLLINIIDLVRGEIAAPGLLVVVVVSTGICGALGGLAYLLSFDGPRQLRTRRLRLYGWLGMLVAALLPTSLTLMIVPMVLIVCPLFPYLKLTEEALLTSE